MQDDRLMDVLTRRRPESDPVRDGDVLPELLLPDPSKGYEPCARPSHIALYTLHCILGADGYRSFQYVHLDSNSTLSVDSQGQVTRRAIAAVIDGFVNDNAGVRIEREAETELPELDDGFEL